MTNSAGGAGHPPGRGPIRVLHVIPTLGRGGAERQLVNVVTCPGQDRLTHLVCSLSTPDDLVPAIADGGVKVFALGLRSTRRWLEAGRRIESIVRAESIDIVQSWLFDATASVFFSRVRSPRPSWVATLHNPDYERATIEAASLPVARVRALQALEMTMARWPSTLVAASNAIRSSATRQLRLSPDRVRVIHNSVDPRHLPASPEAAERFRRSLGLTPADFLFVNIGRLDPQKGQTDLIRAFAETDEASHLAIVGRGPLEEELRRLATAVGLSDRVHLPGPTDDPGGVLAAADAFVFPSRFEGFGIALAEALYLGRPSIATRLDALEELAGEACLLVTPDSVVELAEAMKRVRRDEALCTELSERGPRRINQGFLTTQVVEQWRALYEDLVGRSRERP